MGRVGRVIQFKKNKCFLSNKEKYSLLEKYKEKYSLLLKEE